MPICFILLMHCVRAAASRTFCTAGTNRLIKMAMIAITTSSSMSVKISAVPDHGDPRPFLILGHELGLGQRDDVLRPGLGLPRERVGRGGAQGVAGHVRRAFEKALCAIDCRLADHGTVALEL